MLALFTRRTPDGFLNGAFWIALASIVLLGLGTVLGIVSLAVQRDAMDVDSPPPGDGHRHLLVIALLAMLAVGVTMGQLGALLSGFHQPGEASLGPSAAQGIGNPLDRKADVDEALITWLRYARPDKASEVNPDDDIFVSGQAFDEDPNAPITVLAWFFGLDSGLFVAAYFATLGLLLVLATRALRVRRGNIHLSAGGSSPHAAIDAYLAIARKSTILLGAAIVADQVENWTALTSTASAWFAFDADKTPPMAMDGLAASVLGTATLLKWFLLAFVLVGLLLIGFHLLRHGAASRTAWSGVRSGWHSFLAVRIQILTVVLFAVVMSMPFQVADTFRRWTDDWWVALIATIIVLVFALGIWQSARWSVRLDSETARIANRAAVLWLSVGTVIALLLFGEVGGGVSWKAMGVPLAIASILVVLSVVCKSVPTRPPILPGRRASVLPRVLAVSLVAFFGLAVVKASSGTLIYEWMQGGALAPLVGLVVWGLILIFGSLLLAKLPAVPEVEGERRRHRAWVPSFVLLACVVVWMIVVVVLDRSVYSVAPRIGTAGVLAAFLLLLTYTLSSAVAVGSSAATAPPAVFRAAGLRRTPVLSLIVVWVLALSLLPLDFPLHVMVARRRGDAPARSENLAGAFHGWEEANCLLGETPTAGRRAPKMRAVPLVLVSSSGGGVRAAVWTSFVMDQVFGYSGEGLGCTADGLRSADRSRQSGPKVNNRAVFAVSGISGGGLGFLEYAAQLTRGAPDRTARARIREHLGDDSLAPTLAWMLFVESSWSLLRFKEPRDRGDILQESWARQWPAGRTLEQDFLGLREKHPEVPLLLMNGASAESGCRFNGSILDANGRSRDDTVVGCLESAGLAGASGAVLPSTIDLVDFLCEGQTMSLAEAGLLTARFPGISPVGEVQQCSIRGEDPDERDPHPETFVVDGGYLEGSGTATLVDLWQALEPLVADHNRDPASTACIVPFFVQIDNSYLEPAGPGDVKAPPALLGLQEASANKHNRNGYTTASRQAAQIAFRQPFGLEGITAWDASGEEITDRFALFSPRAHPGSEAPLGWTLSHASFSDLFDQFVERNGASLATVRSWFAGLSCTGGPLSS
jgi:hypothetical protein